jgi:hypothetical protein
MTLTFLFPDTGDLHTCGMDRRHTKSYAFIGKRREKL